MDPNDCLKRILETAKQIEEDEESNSIELHDYERLASQLAEDVLHLHRRLIHGGPLPDSWARK